MADINKVRDELVDRIAEQWFKEAGWVPTEGNCLPAEEIAKRVFDAAITHLSKQSVAFDPSNSWPVLMKVCKSLGINPASETYNDLSALLERQHQQTAAIYEARLAIANNLIRACAGFVYNHDNVGITKADVKEYINALDKESK